MHDQSLGAPRGLRQRGRGGGASSGKAGADTGGGRWRIPQDLAVAGMSPVAQMWQGDSGEVVQWG